MRAGRDLQVIFFSFLSLVLAYAMAGEQLFGSELSEFSSLPRSFFTLSICFSGSGSVYRKIITISPFIGPLYFFSYSILWLLIITPLFLATLNDGYAVRNEQLRVAHERKLKLHARREKERKKAFEESNMKQISWIHSLVDHETLTLCCLSLPPPALSNVARCMRNRFGC